MAGKSKDFEYLRKIPIFSSMSDEELQGIMDAPENGFEDYGPKELIIRESDIAECMYVVLDGIVEVSLRGSDAYGREAVIATLRPGDFFGEQALADNTTTGRRGASVRSLNAARLLRIDKKHVRLGMRASDKPVDDATLPGLAPEMREARKLLKSMRLFQSLTDTEFMTMDTWSAVTQVGPGDFVIKESERGDCMYVILDGVVEIFTLDEDGKICILATLERGNYFGEQALMPGSTGERSAYARTENIARLIRIPKEYFRLILNRDSDVARALLKVGQAQKKQKEEFSRGH